MIDGIDSARNEPGEEFAASVDAPVVIDEVRLLVSGDGTCIPSSGALDGIFRLAGSLYDRGAYCKI